MEQQNNSKSTKVMSTVISLLVIAAAVFLGSKLLSGDLYRIIYDITYNKLYD